MKAILADLVVVGGGPVGLATALHADRAGLSTVVVEPRPQPVDKACGEGLMPSALHELAGLGVDPPGRPFRGIRYVDERAGAQAVALFRGDPGRGVRRTTLHAALSDRIAGATVTSLATRVVDVGWDRHRAGVVTADGHRVEADFVVAADGLHSPVRRMLALSADRRAPSQRPSRYGLRRHFRVEPWSPYVDVHWADGVEAYVTPVCDDVVGVALLTDRRCGWEALLQRFPRLRERLVDAEPVDRVLGAGPLRQPVSHRSRGKVLLAGDAAGYVDALTGEGLAVGLVSARLAVESLVEGSVGSYDRRWRAATRRSRWLTELTVSVASVPWARQRLVVGAARFPRAFSAAVHALE